MLTVQDVQELANGQVENFLVDMRYVNQSVVDAAIDAARLLMSMGFEQRQGLCFFPANEALIDPIIEGLGLRHIAQAERIAAYIMQGK